MVWCVSFSFCILSVFRSDVVLLRRTTGRVSFGSLFHILILSGSASPMLTLSCPPCRYKVSSTSWVHSPSLQVWEEGRLTITHSLQALPRCLRSHQGPVDAPSVRLFRLVPHRRATHVAVHAQVRLQDGHSRRTRSLLVRRLLIYLVPSRRS